MFLFKKQIIVFIYPYDDACQYLYKISTIIANQYTALLSVLISVINSEDILKDELEALIFLLPFFTFEWQQKVMVDFEALKRLKV